MYEFRSCATQKYCLSVSACISYQCSITVLPISMPIQYCNI